MAKRVKREPESPNPAIQRCFKAYHDTFVARHGIKPQWTRGKDAALLKAMLETWDELTVLRLIEVFIWGNDSWAVRRGWTIAALHDLAPRLLTRHSAPSDAKTCANLEAAAAAMQPRSKGSD